MAMKIMREALEMTDDDFMNEVIPVVLVWCEKKRDSLMTAWKNNYRTNLKSSK